MNIDVKILSSNNGKPNITTLWKDHIPYQVGFMLGIQRWFNIPE
jgi:hypothetical protein